ncbi:MAG: ABC transporter permease [Vallitalea sp.]|nr:ABC transporter permease [Vallitalea sp.]
MKSYLSVFKLRLITGMQYRIAAIASIFTQLSFGFIFIMIFDAFYSSNPSIQPISFNELVTYTWLKQAFLFFIMPWFRDGEIFNLITKGNIAYELCRPINLYGFWYSKLIASRVSNTLLRCLPVLCISFILPKPYNISLPIDLSTFSLFCISLILGLVITVAISMLMYISVFITMSPAGSSLVFCVLGEFFSGLAIPIPLMPTWLQRIVYVLPFRLTCDMPFRIYLGHIPKNKALTGILIQFIWLTILLILGQVIMKKTLKKVIVQGG